jgi:Spy/CpxP family protein refolding chaperone
MDEQTTLILLSGLLNLSASQQQQLGAVFDAAVIAAHPLATQMESDREVLFEAVKSGKSDDEIKNLAEHEGSLVSRMLALQARTFSNMWRLLSSEQKSKVDASMYGYIGGFLFNATQPVPPSVGEAPARPPTS